MADRVNDLLAKGNKAFQTKKFENAISFYTQAIHDLPLFKDSINFNIILTEARKNNESIIQTIFNKEMVRYVNEAKQNQKKAITALILTADCSRYYIDEAYLAAEILDELACHVVFSCFQIHKGKSSPLLSYKHKSLPIITIKNFNESTTPNELSKKIRPDLVFYCGPAHLVEPIHKIFEKKNIPFVLIDSANEKSLTEQSNYINFRKLFIESYKKHSTYIKIKTFVDSVLKKYSPPNMGPKPPINTLPQGKDIILFWKQNDTGLYGRRPDMIAKYLASREDIRKILVIDAPITQTELNTKKNGLSLTHDRDIYVKTYEKLFCQLDSEKISHHVYIGKNSLPHNEGYEELTEYNFSPYKKYLEKIFTEEGITTQNATFWFYPKNYFATNIIEIFRPKNIVVDVVDDHRAWPGVPLREKEKLSKHYKDILSKANICIANCQAVVDSMKEFNSNILMIPNGCEEHAEIIEPWDNSAYNEIKEFEGKILGFVGNLESKIDIPLLEKLAQEFTDALIVLVGSTHANPKVRDLQQYPNIRFTGVVEYKYINAFVKRFTAGIVPHLRTSLTESMNPLKVFVYATNRIPIVCSDIDNLPQGDFIHVTKSHEEFIEKCNYILQRSPAKDNASYIKFIEMNSWRNRLEKLVDKI